MNNRDYKIFAANTYHHVYNRGNGKMEIFKDGQDFSNFLKRLKLVLGIETIVPITQWAPLRITPFPKESFSIISYCLMPNHFHFLIRQNSEISISNFVSKLCSSYGKYFNKKYEHAGGLFQDQFKSILVDSDRYLLWLSAYIQQNPAVAGLVKDLKDYPYSSYCNYLSLKDDGITNTSLILGMVKNDRKAYEQFVLQSFVKINQAKDLEYLMLD